MSGGEKPNRVRPVRKILDFSPSEWERAERRFRLSGVASFSAFAREAVLESEIRVERIDFDPIPLRAELSRIGNNINQIARHVNAEDAVTFSEMQATRALLARVQEAISRASDGGES